MRFRHLQWETDTLRSMPASVTEATKSMLHSGALLRPLVRPLFPRAINGPLSKELIHRNV